MAKDTRRYHVFVIEDNPGDFLLIADYLEEQIAAPAVTHAKSFKEAAKLFATVSEKVDVILLIFLCPIKMEKRSLPKPYSFVPTARLLFLPVIAMQSLVYVPFQWAFPITC